MAWAKLLPYLIAGAQWGWRNRRDLLWTYDRLRGHRQQRRRGGYRTGYAKGYTRGMRQQQNRRNFGYGRGGMSRRGRRR